MLLSIGVISLLLVVLPQRHSLAHGIDGYAWLSWSNDSRQLYLLGFLHAYRMGFADACLAAGDVSKPKWTINEIGACKEKEMSFSRDLPDLNKAITHFYQQYADDRGLELDVLLRQFSDQKHRSAKEIHTMLEAREPL
jgi:Mg2+ and Co2+ transporter CorA